MWEISDITKPAGTWRCPRLGGSLLLGTWAACRAPAQAWSSQGASPSPPGGKRSAWSPGLSGRVTSDHSTAAPSAPSLVSQEAYLIFEPDSISLSTFFFSLFYLSVFLLLLCVWFSTEDAETQFHAASLTERPRKGFFGCTGSWSTWMILGSDSSPPLPAAIGGGCRLFLCELAACAD